MSNVDLRRFVDDLASPTFRYRMAHGRVKQMEYAGDDETDTGQYAAARARLATAERDLLNVLRSHALDTELGAVWNVVQDLDRCVHGRHELDPCIGCRNETGNVNDGNPYLDVAIGVTVRGSHVLRPRDLLLAAGLEPAETKDAS